MLELLLIVALVYFLAGSFIASHVPFYNWYFADKENVPLTDELKFVSVWPYHLVKYLQFISPVPETEDRDILDFSQSSSIFVYDPSATSPEDENLNAGYFPKKTKAKKKPVQKSVKKSVKKVSKTPVKSKNNTSKKNIKKKPTK